MKYKEIERVAKGFSNHRRLQILDYVAKHPTVSVDQLTTALGANFITIAKHTQKLADTNLVAKEYRGRMVIHTITPLGKKVLAFCQTL